MAKNILMARQLTVLQKIGSTPAISQKFYLSGGTALAGFHLHHRYSEDLDFFSENEVDVLTLDTFWQDVQARLSITKIDFQQSYNRNLFFLHFGEEVLKTEFTYYPFPRIEKGHKEFGVTIDSLLDIAVNKLFTIYQRTQARDYIDLYCICQEKDYTIADLIKHAKIKFDWHIDPLQLGTQFVKADEALDYPKMIKKIKPEEWQSFFSNEAKKLRPQILE